MQLPALCIAVTLMIVRNSFGHTGVELFAHSTERSKWFGWLGSNTDHDRKTRWSNAGIRRTEIFSASGTHGR
jgi:hypothetical protein